MYDLTGIASDGSVLHLRRTTADECRKLAAQYGCTWFVIRDEADIALRDRYVVPPKVDDDFPVLDGEPQTHDDLAQRLRGFFRWR